MWSTTCQNFHPDCLNLLRQERIVKGQSSICKGIDWVVVLYLVDRQLRFFLYSGAVTTKALAVVVFPLLSLVSGSVEYPMSYASCLVSCNVGWRFSACPVALCLMDLCLSKDLGLCSLFYLGYFCITPWNSLSGLCALWYSLSSFQASNWAGVL